MTQRVLMLAGNSDASRALAGAFAREFADFSVIVEEPMSRAALLKSRANRLGKTAALGQAMFIAAGKALSWKARARVREIRTRSGLGPCEWPTSTLLVRTVNDTLTAQRIGEFQPDVIVVAGTRIIRRHILRATEAPFINMHAGITPRYRGVHGGYWALAQGDPSHAGVTVHLVDEGVDTGRVIAQACFTPSAADSFFTYPWLQLEAGLPLFLEATRAALEGTLRTYEVNLDSHQWYHPTVWGWLWTGLSRGVW